MEGDLKKWISKRQHEAKLYEDGGETKAAEDYRAATVEIGEAYGRGDPAARVVVAIKLREHKLTPADRLLLEQVRQDPDACARAEMWLGSTLDSVAA